MRSLVFPSSRVQWARTLTMLLVILAIFLVARDWPWFFVEGMLALIYVIVFLSRYARVPDGRGLEQMTVLRFIRRRK